MELREKFLEQTELLQKYVFERDAEIALMNHALLTKQHTFYVGDPGAAKTFMVQLKQRLIKDAKGFYNNCHPFTKPAELIGPEDINKFKTGIQEFVVDNHLVMAHIAMLDEVFKANKQLSCLLPVLNERMFSQNGKTIHSNLITCFMASNELPTDKTLQAFYNRILFKFEVKWITDRDTRKKLLHKKDLPKFPENPDCAITLEELAQAQAEVMQVKIPDEVDEMILTLIDGARSEFVPVSDRQQEWCVYPVMAEAWLNGRSVATVEDCEVLKHCLWDDPKEQKPAVFKLVNGLCNRELDDILNKLDTVIGPNGIIPQWIAAGPSANHRETEDQIKCIIQELERNKPSKKNEGEYNRVLKLIRNEHKNIIPFAVKQARVR